jgi:hypothetical protein
MKEKKAQLTIFIIIALVILAVLLILFYPRVKVFITGPSTQEYIRDCTEEAAEEVLEKVVLQGGSIEPENYVLYDGEKVAYACYTDRYYEKCVMQKPFLKQDIEKSVSEYVEPRVKNCISSLKADLESKGNDVSVGEISVETSIVPNSIVVTVNAPMIVTKSETSSYNKFKTSIRSELYDLVMIASSISNWEARYGDSETMNYMLYYPDIKIEKKKLGDGSTVYILTNRETLDKFVFASRSVALPAGITGE